MTPRLSSSVVTHIAQSSPPWGFDGLGYFVYKRTYSRRLEDGSHESWINTCQRVVNGFQDIGAGYTEDELGDLLAAIYQLKALPAGRMLWQLGTDNVERLGGDSLCNCWFTTIKRPDDFGFIFDELMLGGGVGFRIDRAHTMPTVVPTTVMNRNVVDSDIIVPDKREGWVMLLEEVIKAHLGLRPGFTYSTQFLRPKGSPIRTFGGVASGPGILEEGVHLIGEIFKRRIGRRLTSVDALDIANIIGSVVVSGNVRRSAEIALGQPDDLEYLAAKRWDLTSIPRWRGMSNNSVYVSDIDELPDMFWEGYSGNGEPYGMFNLEASRRLGRIGEERYDPTIEGVNPCGEIPLASRESCNLAELFLPNITSAHELTYLAQLLHKGQKAVAALPYRREDTTEIIRENMRLGTSVSGVAQAGDTKLGWLRGAYESLRDFDRHNSRQRDWNESVRLTTIKPSGTISLLAGVTPGIHPGFSQHHLRRVRVAANDPLLGVAERAGYHSEVARTIDGSDDVSTMVLEFPCRFPAGTTLAHEVSAVDQLQMAKQLATDWVDNAVSVTVYYDESELDDVKRFLRKNWSEMKSVSFLKRSEHGFDQAPLEEISEAEYVTRRQGLTRVDGEVDLGDAPLMDDCDTGACPIR